MLNQLLTQKKNCFISQKFHFCFVFAPVGVVTHFPPFWGECVTATFYLLIMWCVYVARASQRASVVCSQITQLQPIYTKKWDSTTHPVVSKGSWIGCRCVSLVCPTFRVFYMCIISVWNFGWIKHTPHLFLYQTSPDSGLVRHERLFLYL